MALKGLILYGQNKKTEGFEWCKKGVATDFFSYLTWQCLGMLYRAEKNYLEAAKCYRKAVSMDTEKANELVNLRDLSVLEIQTRDVAGFVVSVDCLKKKQKKFTNHFCLFVFSLKF